MIKSFLRVSLLMALLSMGTLVIQAADTGPQPKAAPPPPVRLTTTPTRQQAFVYTTTPEGDLKLQLFSPQSGKATDKRAAIVFFHGGGGNATQFFPQAEYFASRGLVCAAVNYPIILEGTKIVRTDESIAQGKSAMRWMRAHASELGIDPKRIVAAGGSWGGMLALATALVPGFDSAGDDSAVPCEPNALLLFNPSIQPLPTAQNAAGDLIGEKITPALFQRKNAPPALYFFGTNDGLNKRAPEFIARSQALGNRCEYFTAKEQPHGFFNREPWLTATTLEADRFLVSLGYLSGVATLPPAEATLDAVK